MGKGGKIHYLNSTDVYSRNSEDSTSPRTRRSSIVVIPPMQICPGDLLVYGKVLSQRKSLLGKSIFSFRFLSSLFSILFSTSLNVIKLKT